MESTQLSLFGKTYPEHSLPMAGGDFQCVVEEMCRIADSRVTIPRPDSGRWLTAGAIVGGNYSIAWRVMDAQYWGVPQRRRRIALVADFGGQRAAKILFECKSVRWNPQTGEKAWQSTAAGAAGSAGTAVTLRMRSGCAGGGKGPLIQEGKSGTLGCNNDQTLFEPCICIAGNVVDRKPKNGGNGKGYQSDVSYTLNTVDRHAVAILPFDTTQITSPQNGNHPHYGDPCHPLATGAHAPAIVESYQDKTGTLSPGAHPGCYNGQDAYNDMLVTSKVLPDVVGTLCASAAGLSRPAGQGNETDMCVVTAVDCRNLTETIPKSGTLQSKSSGGYSLNYINPVRNGYIVRRLTPLECERLQGYPDRWTDIPGASDSARYKALGNSIALPQWDYVLRGISKYLPPRAKLGSLFDGIGGFPLTWERIQGAGTARWASEIEKFPMQVTAIRFKEEKDDRA